MKKTFTRIFSLLTAILLIMTVAGCGTRVAEESIWIEGDDTVSTVTHSSGTKNEGGKEQSTSNNKVDKDGKTDVENIDTSNADKFNLKGATVVVGAYMNSNGGKLDPSSPTYQDEVKLLAEIEKKYNCKIEYKTAPDSMSFYNAWTVAAQAGTKFCDVLQIATSVVVPTHIRSGYLAKLDDYLDMDSPIYNKGAMEQSEYKGGHYITVMANRLYAPNGLFFNRKVFEAFGIDTPDVYVKKNEWNWNKFVELAKATTGTKGGIDYYGYGFEKGDVDLWAIANNTNKVVVKNGKHVFNMGSEPYLNAIQHAYDLVNTHKVTGGKFTDGNVAMCFDRPTYGASHNEVLGSKNVGFTYIPKGPNASTYTSTVDQTTAWAIPATVKNPEVMANIMYDLTYPYKWRQTLQEQLEGNFGDETSLQTAMDITIKANDNINLSPIYSYIRGVTLSGFGFETNTSPRAYVASVAAEAQAELDAVWAQ